MKNTLILLMLLFANASFMSCRSNDEPHPEYSLYSGTDLSGYFVLKADTASKKSSIEMLKPGAWKLYDATNVDNFDFSTPLLQGTTQSTISLFSTFGVYCLEWADGSRYGVGLRQLPITGQTNFRDLGGYKTKDGRHVKWGLIFRSGKCHDLTASDLQYLSTVPLKTMVDFRTLDEQNNEPDAVPSSVVAQKSLPTTLGDVSSINLNDTSTCYKYLHNVHVRFPIEHKEELRSLFALLMNPSNTPLMFHCSSGKDRAGIAAALILLSLGVDMETVMDDYMLSNNYSDKTLENLEALYGKEGNIALSFYILYSVHREDLEAALSAIEENYGSIDAYIINQLGVDTKKMRDLYLY